MRSVVVEVSMPQLASFALLLGARSQRADYRQERMSSVSPRRLLARDAWAVFGARKVATRAGVELEPRLSFKVAVGVSIASPGGMGNIFKALAISALLIVPAAPAPAHAQVSFGLSIGQPPPPRNYRVPPRPGPDYEWVEGYWYPVNGRWTWHTGYWTRPPYEGAYWVAPYYEGGRYYGGEWEGSRGAVQHDHRWDRDRGRDERHEPSRDDRDRDRR